MRKHVLIVLGFIFVGGCRDRRPLADVLERPTKQTYRYIVRPEDQFLDTGLIAFRGQPITFSVLGSVIASTGEAYGPDGKTGTTCLDCIAGGTPFNLGARIENSFYVIGSSRTLPGAPLSQGRIEIFINTGSGANSATGGSFTVDIKID